MLLNSHNILDESLTQSEPSAQPVYYGFFMCRRYVTKDLRGISKKKRCSKCKLWKYKSEFPKNRTRPDGLALQCFTCKNEYYAKDREYYLAKSKAYFSTEKGKLIRANIRKRHRAKNPSRMYIYVKIDRLIKRGILKKPDYCQVCGIKDKIIQGHHFDYSKEKELEVVWVCPLHHTAIHKGKITKEFFIDKGILK